MSNSLLTETYQERRSTSWHGTVPWRYGNLIEPLSPLPFPDDLSNLANGLKVKLGRDYSACLVNYYEDEDVGMKYHSDPDQKCNSEVPLFRDETTVVSRGTPACMKFRRRDRSFNFEIFVFSGDGVSMVEDCQVLLEHGVEGYGERLSYVFKGEL